MPLICPRPGLRNPGADCPLYDHRLVFASESQALRRLIVSAKHRPSLALLIEAEAAAAPPNSAPSQLPAPIPSPTFPQPKVIPERN